MTTSPSDVSHPIHYTRFSHEVIELTSRLDFCSGNAVKYLLRFPFKGEPKKDLQKALWYVSYQYARQVGGEQFEERDDEVKELFREFIIDSGRMLDRRNEALSSLIGQALTHIRDNVWEWAKDDITDAIKEVDKCQDD